MDRSNSRLIVDFIIISMPHDISVKTLQKFLDKVQWTQVIQKAPHTPKGQRLFPSRTPKNDSNLNFRVDKGADVGGQSELIIQANKNAVDRKVREAAQKDSHAILAKGVVEANDRDGTRVKAQLEQDFKARKQFAITMC